MNLTFIKRSIVIFTGILLFSSCKEYQFATVISDTYRPEIHENVIENDTVLIRYLFLGENCPITVSIFNKLKQPLYVDWSKSSVIINSEKQSYWVDEARINSTSRELSYQYTKSISTTYGNMQGSIIKNEKISFIPPNAGVVYTPIQIQPNWIEVGSEEYTGEKVKIATVYGAVKGNAFTYNKSQTPLDFRSFLTLSVDEQFSKPMYFDNAFWVSEIFTTKAKPEELSNIFPNQFHNTRTTKGGLFFGGVFLGALVLTGILVAN